MPIVEILAIGRLKEKAEKSLEARYLERISKAGPALGIKTIFIREINESRQDTSAARKAKEAEELLKKRTLGSYLIALDEHGKQQKSTTLAKQIESLLAEGHPAISFALGGPDGHGEELLKSAKSCLSLSPMTLPHGLARIILLEQLYRATTIWSGHPYHRE